MVDFLGVGCDYLAGDFAQQVQHHFVLAHGLLGIGRCFGMLAGLGEVLFFGSDHLVHIRMVEIERKVLVIGIEIHHYFRFFL